MRILFWGTPAYAVPSLEAVLEAGHQVVGVVSQPDRRRGRGASLSPSPVKRRALELGLPVLTPERLRRDLSAQAELASLQAEASLVVAYGQILPKAVLDQPPLGCWNGHGSLLPRWRGAAPIQWALLAGDAETGVGIMAMEEGLDTGPVLLEERLAIGPLENAHQLADRMAALTARLLVESLPRIAGAGGGSQAERWARLSLRPQAHEGVTLARLLTRADYGLDWGRPALEVHRRVMGLFPSAHTHWRGQRLKVLATEPLRGSPGDTCRQEVPGSVVALREGEGVVVATGEGALLVREAQLEGRRPCAGTALLQQLRPQPGEVFGEAWREGEGLRQTMLSGASDSSAPNELG